MRLYLVRHGETVDNVAGLYAGSRDSTLTNHGVQQGKKLGEYLGVNNVQINYIFASNLQRAYKTAEYIIDGQSSDVARPEVTQLPCLREQDFGSMEGVAFGKRPYEFKTGKQTTAERIKEQQAPGFVEIETKEALGKRGDEFLDDYLMPIIHSEASSSTADQELTIVVVSHGIMLSALWRRLLKRLPARSITLHADITAKGPVLDLQHLGGWSNTGYLELVLTRKESQAAQSIQTRPANNTNATKKDEAKVANLQSIDNGAPSDEEGTPIPGAQSGGTGAESVDTSATAKIDALDAIALPVVKERVTDYHERPTEGKALEGWATIIQTINGKAHLEGLKRARGGIGSAAHDEKQKSLEGFFKKQKT